MYSTVRVNIGHGTGFKDPLKLLKNTQEYIVCKYNELQMKLSWGLQ